MKELPIEKLRKNVEPTKMHCKTTKELTPLHGIIGQERATRALQFGISIKEQGFNIVLETSLPMHTVAVSTKGQRDYIFLEIRKTTMKFGEMGEMHEIDLHYPKSLHKIVRYLNRVLK